MNRSTADVEARSVAVIGMACRFPGAPGTDHLWELLCNGADATGDTPSERYDVDALYSTVPKPGTVRSRRAGYVQDMAAFDAEFFEMSPTDATELDPQHRLLLMAAWEALEDAGQRPDSLAGSRTGVFVGNAHADFLEMQYRKGLQAATASQFHNYRSLLSARLSYFFDLRGPSMVLDTACSSALVAVHTAMQSLRAGEVPLALAAGVNIKLRPDEAVMMTQAGTLARDGRSKFGDADADGYAPSDGVGVVVLKPLAAALADGDRIRAVLQGSAVSNDGRTGGALLTPSLAGQVDVLRWAYQDAGVNPADVDFVEAHGVGSPTLDPLEFTAIGEVMGRGRPAERPCLVGSVKTNIGHSEAAGGLAGLIKTVLCLEHGQVPASLHLATPNPRIAWDRLALRVPDRLQPLPYTGRPALAGVSGQGVSALNAHLVVRQGDTVAAGRIPTPRGLRGREVYLLPLSARSPEALADLVRAYAEYLGPYGRGAAYQLRDICFSASTRRQHHPYRTAVVGTSHEEMLAALHGTGTPRRKSRSALAVAERYCAGETIDWHEVYGPGFRYVPLPTYPWQLKRYWPGEQRASQAGGDLADAVLREHARTSYTDSSMLAEIGIDSLAMLRIIVELSEKFDRQVEPEELARLHDVAALRQWLLELEAQKA
ncbi:hypothetical protein GCM10018793_56730 [Streptomyces sulfonofaciens]|uniref:Polyketide synthase n=1 Tax=Streptomyces sulfonofaciens TaxID=68272 RepID=A0A919GLB4_9ACTN|nr:beta-ketoacyl synthase N-terminal-like domain-containing protein [Streptomyces sulfonofaciens]GHH86101.1 hypothetical protein GCM10018793_56730 [Streptomyces sulfonofaciens]